MDKESILAAIAKPEPRKVEVPEWGTAVYLKPLSAGEWFSFMWDQSLSTEARMCRMLALAITDEKGEAIFDEDDLAAMPASQAAPLSRLVNEVHGMKGDAGDIAKK